MSVLVSTNPGRNYEKVGEVKISTPGEIKKVVDRAGKAKREWREAGLSERIGYVEKLAKVYEKRKEEIAKLTTLEMGKPIVQSREDVEFDLENIANKIEMAPECLEPEVLDESETSVNKLYHEPHGVVAVIIPWNYPTSNFFISALQVLLAGNVVVLKHSEETPMVGKMLEEIMNEAGFPAGVFGEVYGDGKVGDCLTDQEIDAIHFTGSSKVGEYLYRKAAEKFIPVVLEMGGSSPGIVFEDADLEVACGSVSAERYANCGQICCALKRLVVHESIFDKVVGMMKVRVGAMKVGEPMDEGTEMGPLVAKRQVDLLAEQVDDTVSMGAKVVVGGRVMKKLKGAYYEPTVLTGVTPQMRVWREEVFGPVLPIVSFGSEDEALRIANDTPYGLSTYVYGKDVERMRKMALQVDAGQVSINGVSYFSKHSPFGGYKRSGMGRNDGRYGFEAATQKKVVAEPK